MDDKLIKDAQYRKGLSIAFFNATNSAIELVKLEQNLPSIVTTKVTKKDIKNLKDGKVVKVGKIKTMKSPTTESRIEYWREYMLKKHAEYYANVIANVGSNYKAVDSIKKLLSATTYEEFKSVWLGFSEDERHDGEIKKVAKELKEKFKTNEKA